MLVGGSNIAAAHLKKIIDMAVASLEKLKSELIEVEKSISKHCVDNSYTSQVARHFHLGMVGGSGKNTYRLNKRREREIEKKVSASKNLIALEKRKDFLTAEIKDIENNGPEKRKQQDVIRNNIKVQYWNSIKVGDKIDVGGNAPVEVTRKNKKSIQTGIGCTWTAAEIIGKDAAKLI